MNKLCLVVAIACIVIVSGCTDQEVKELRIPGHSETYTFSNDLRDVLKISSNDPEGIRTLLFATSATMLVFDGSSQEDNAIFAVTAVNLGKITTFFANEGKVMHFIPFYYIGDQWFAANGTNITQPVLTGPVIWLKGPRTGAHTTGVTLENNTIFVEGTSYTNMTKAGDRFTLDVFGISQIP